MKFGTTVTHDNAILKHFVAKVLVVFFEGSICQGKKERKMSFSNREIMHESFKTTAPCATLIDVKLLIPGGLVSFPLLPRYRLRPRMLRDVSQLDMRVKLFGDWVDFPVCVAPTSTQKAVHPDGELATARGMKC